MKGYDTKFLEELKSKNDIVEVISSYIRLEQKGRNFWGACPFHHEKTPSFCINREEQFYHCFGCHKGGDVISFIMEYESLEFSDAVRLLADRVKMPLPDFEIDSEKIRETKKKKERLLKLLRDTAVFYVNNLKSERAEKHLRYVYGRGITREAVKQFGIGASLSFEELPAYLLKQGYLYEEMLDSGVVGVKNGRYYDELGGRLIIPIINQFNEVVAFGGRLMEKADFAKYKNTKETIVFSKSHILYNVNNLKKLKNEEGLKQIIIVEGYMDTISLYMGGFKNVVASMGTSLTKDQARILKRYCENVIISYDGDFAGQKASIRGLEILKEEGVNVKVISLPDEMDPDDVIKKKGSQFYQALIDDAKLLIDYKLDILKKKFDLKTSEGRRKYIEKALEVVKESASASEQEELLKTIRDETGITYESLKRQFDNVPLTPVKKVETKIESAGEKTLQARRFVLSSVLFEKPYATEFDITSIKFEDASHKEIVEYIKARKETGERIKPNILYDVLSDEHKEELSKILSLELEEDKQYNEERYFNDCVKTLKRDAIDKDVAKLKEMLAKAETIEERKVIAEKLNEMIKKRI